MKEIYTNFCKQTNKHLLCLVLVFALFGITTQAQITGTSPASRCGEGSVVLHATAPSGGTITWYADPFYGTPFPVGTGAGTVSAEGTTFTTPSLAATTTFYVDAVDANGCSNNAGGIRVGVTATISENAMQASIFYASTTFCKSANTLQAVTLTGTSGGDFTVSPSSGLDINDEGGILPSNSAADTYTITYTAPPTTGCVEEPATAIINIVDAPVAPIISYTDPEWCTNETEKTVTHTGADGGSYSATPSGLIIDSGSGTITPNGSMTGTYTVIYYVPGVGGCDPQTANATVEILQLPTASISYATDPFTQNQGSQSVTLTGTGVYTGGTYTKTAGDGTLTLDALTGAITPSSSDAGTYTITYTLDAVSPCGQVAATTEVTIYDLPTASITGGADVCQGAPSDPEITFTGSNGTAPYTFTYKINDGFELSVSTTAGNSVAIAQSVLTTGTYEYELVSVADANGSTRTYSTLNTATITVNIPEVALFSYTGSPYCSSGTNPTPTFFDGGVAGTFSSSTGLVFGDAATGEINLLSSTAGTYTVTNTIAAAGGCSEVVATADITITRLPVATFSYDDSPYCASATGAAPTVNDVGVFTCDNQFLSFMEGDGVAPGTINLNLTPTGTYTITNTISAADGCAMVVENATIEIQSAPQVSNTGLYQICSGENTDITLTSNPSGANFSWTIGTVGTDIVGASAGSGTSISQALSNSSNTVTGSVEYIVTPTLGTGACAVGSPFTITVNVNPLPVAPTANDLTITYNGTEHTASATPQAGSSVVWYDAASGGTATTAPTGTNAGTHTAYAEAVNDNTGCISASRTEVTLTIAKATITDQAITGITAPATGGTPVTNASNATQYGATITWSPADATFASGTVYTATITVTPTSNYTLTGVAANSFTVAGASATNAINSGTVTAVFPGTVPAAPTGAAAQSFCTGSTIDDLKATLTGTVIKLYNAATAGTEYTNGSEALVNGTIYYATQTVNGVESTSRLAVTATVVAAPTGGTISPASTTVCSGTNSTLLTLSGYNGTVDHWLSSTDNWNSEVEISNTASTYTASNLTADTKFKAVVDNASCPEALSVEATISVTTTLAATPVITTTIYTYTTSISGTSIEADGTEIELFKDETSLGTTTVASNAWTKTSITGLVVGNVITAKATATGKCVSNASAGVTVAVALSIGDAYQGGIIAYILQSGDPGYDANVQHGLIAAISDQSTGIQWYNGTDTVTGATATSIGTGSANTTTIINVQAGTPTDYAAGLARAHTGGGYSDWYLPSKDELNKLYLNKVAIGGFASASYWSSSEFNNDNAWYQIFGNGQQGSNGKAFTAYVRAVRAF